MKSFVVFLAASAAIFVIVASDSDCKGDSCHKDEDYELLMVHMVSSKKVP